MIILGIDPGSLKTGYALIEVESQNKCRLLASGVIKLKGEKDFFHRLASLKEEIAQIVENFNPDEVAMESLIFVKSPTSLIKLAQARGVILGCVLDEHKDKFFEYSPNQIKQVTTGHGHADKEGIQKLFKMIFKVESFETDDESDALAVAYCHFLNRYNTIKQPTRAAKAKRGGLASSLAHAMRNK